MWFLGGCITSAYNKSLTLECFSDIPLICTRFVFRKLTYHVYINSACQYLNL